MSLPVRIRCPYLEQNNDINRLGESDAENTNFLAEINAMLLAYSLEIAHDMGVVGCAALLINSLPAINEDFTIGTETWTFVAARGAAYQVTRGATVDAAVTNAAAAINLDTTEDMVAEADLVTNQIRIFNADGPAGDKEPGGFDAALAETLADVASVWDQENLEDAGIDNLIYQSHIRIEANLTNIATPFAITTLFTPLQIRYRATNAAGVAMPSRTAVAIIVNDLVAVNLGFGGDPMVAGEYFELDIYGNELI